MRDWRPGTRRYILWAGSRSRRSIWGWPSAGRWFCLRPERGSDGWWCATALKGESDKRHAPPAAGHPRASATGPLCASAHLLAARSESELSMRR
jgi:hypothetical protein